MGDGSSAPTQQKQKTPLQATAAFLAMFNGLLCIGPLANLHEYSLSKLILLPLIGVAGAICGYVAYKRPLHWAYTAIAAATLVIGVLLR